MIYHCGAQFWKCLRDLYFGWIKGGPREMVSNKSLQIISRQTNFWRLQKCLKKQIKKKKQEFAMVIDIQYKMSRHFRFVEQLMTWLDKRIVYTTGKVTAKLKAIERTFCAPFKRHRTPVCNHVSFTTCDVISLTVIVQPRFQFFLSCSERQSFFLEARESILGTRLFIVNFDA